MRSARCDVKRHADAAPLAAAGAAVARCVRRWRKQNCIRLSQSSICRAGAITRMRWVPCMGFLHGCSACSGVAVFLDDHKLYGYHQLIAWGQRLCTVLSGSTSTSCVHVNRMRRRPECSRTVDRSCRRVFHALASPHAAPIGDVIASPRNAACHSVFQHGVLRCWCCTVSMMQRAFSVFIR